jgi:MerR family copper efflux transcriptional regulator
MSKSMKNLQQYLTIAQAAAFLGVTPNTLRNWGREEKIAEHRHPVNNYRLYKKADLETLLRRIERSGARPRAAR